MTNPKILITSPIRYRPDAPRVLADALKALTEQDYSGEIEYHFLVHTEPDSCGELAEQAVRDFIPIKPGDYGASYEVLSIPSPEDSRTLGGPRSTGETQEVLAFLRNRLFRAFQQSDADLCLMVDSDVVLAPGALGRMVEMMEWPKVEDGKARPPGRRTVSLQIDNRIAEEHEPASNAMVRANDHDSDVNVYARNRLPCGGYGKRAPWSDDGLTIKVARAGACTLYPRAALERRFRWDPRYQDEQDALFDDLRELGFEHFLIRDPKLAEHRMKRMSITAGHDAEERCRCEYIQVEAGYLQHTVVDSLTPKPCRAGYGKVWPKPQPPCV